MLLSSEGRKGAALVSLLAGKDSNQVPGALPHKSRQILQGFFPCVAFYSKQLLGVIEGVFREETDSAAVLKQLLG